MFPPFSSLQPITLKEFENPYLTKQIIAYLGNKRRLLPLIEKALQQCEIEIRTAQFIDFFAGTGIVSRLAKTIGFKDIIVNDWEEYSYHLNKGFLEVNPNDLKELYKEKGGLEKVLETLNGLKLENIENPYISKYYAPKELDEKKANYIKERLFYTKRNALKIDVIRDKIEEWYSNANLSAKELKEKSLLIALLLYQAATHTNTSGVFKAYHKGFGGFGKDALGRILGEITLLYPVLYESKALVQVYKKDSLELSKDIHYSIQNSVTYLDPPYNGHQYGSNYHLLNTISLWDKIPVSNETKEDGTLKHKAGIRHDWVKTRSPFCYKDSALKAFKELMENIKSRYILLSYSNDGIIPFDTVHEIAANKGKLSIVTNEYVKYRGGRQSQFRLNKNVEFILIVDTHKKNTKVDTESINAIIERKKLALMFTKTYNKKNLEKYFTFNTQTNEITSQFLKTPIKLQTINFYKMKNKFLAESLTLKNVKELYNILEKCVCNSKEEELHTIKENLTIINFDNETTNYFIKEMVKSLKHLAYMKSHKEFSKWYKILEGYKIIFPKSYAKNGKLITDLYDIFTLRIKNRDIKK